MRFLRENILYISFGPFIGTSLLMEDVELSKAFFVTLSLWLKIQMANTNFLQNTSRPSFSKEPQVLMLLWGQ